MLDFETAAVESERNITGIKDDLERRSSLLEGAVQGAYAAVQAVGPGSGTGGSSGHSRTLSQEKALSDIGKIMGNESVSSLLEWKRKIAIIIDTILPGAYSVLEWAEHKQKGGRRIDYDHWCEHPLIGSKSYGQTQHAGLCAHDDEHGWTRRNHHEVDRSQDGTGSLEAGLE